MNVWYKAFGLGVLEAENGPVFFSVPAEALPVGVAQDFSVQFWMNTGAETERQFVFLSQKEFPDNSLASQKNPGWVFYMSGGTWAWTMGSGARRITYERDDGQYMPLNDGRWHQLTMTYSSERSEIRLFYDGVNWVSYHVSDSDGFDFSNTSPMVVGWDDSGAGPRPEILPAIVAGAEQLQELVDAFNESGVTELAADDLLQLVVDPRRLFQRKVDEVATQRGADSIAFREEMGEVDWDPIREAESGLMFNPYTVRQNMNFTGIAPVSKVYALLDGKVVIQQEAAEVFAEKERLYSPDFEIDNLAVWNRVLSPEEVVASYSGFFEPASADLEEKLSSITAASWNIGHGGKHNTVTEHGFDSRVAIAKMLEAEGVDLVMMQETYSSGDFIAAELGYSSRPPSIGTI